MGERDKMTLLRRLVALLVGLGWLSTSAAVALAAPPATRSAAAKSCACGASWPKT